MGNEGVHANRSWPPCPYCHHRWPKKLDLTWIVILPTGRGQSVVQCPCKKSGIMINIALLDAHFVDIEAAKHYGETT